MKLIVANWKMNPASLPEAVRLARASDARNVVLAPPYLYLPVIAWIVKKAQLGAQDLFWEDRGAYTGEISPLQLKKARVKYVIVGHSERRRLGETDEIVNQKTKAALTRGLKVILCVGEDWSVRRRGIAAAQKYVTQQLKKDLKLITNKLIANNLLIAYEPIWAIGTGKADKPEEAAAISKYIKNFLRKNYRATKIKVLYGGSVNDKNAAPFLEAKEIDGALVGGASLKPREFKKIIQIAR
jgi:triosephosphate isomerase